MTLTTRAHPRAIVKGQFERLRDGDRFRYESYLPQNLAMIIRRNTAIGGEIQNNVFIAPGNPTPMQGHGRK